MRRGRGVKPRLAWESNADNPVTGTVTTSTGATSSVYSFGGEQAEDVTVMRTRGSLYVATSAADAGPTMVGMGLGIISARTAGGTSATVPGAIRDMSWDGWYWHTTFWIEPTGDSDSDKNFYRMPIDSKGKRILHDGNLVFLSIETFTPGTGGQVVDFGVSLRALLKTGLR